MRSLQFLRSVTVLPDRTRYIPARRRTAYQHRRCACQLTVPSVIHNLWLAARRRIKARSSSPCWFNFGPVAVSSIDPLSPRWRRGCFYRSVPRRKKMRRGDTSRRSESWMAKRSADLHDGDTKYLAKMRRLAFQQERRSCPKHCHGLTGAIFLSAPRPLGPSVCSPRQRERGRRT